MKVSCRKASTTKLLISISLLSTVLFSCSPAVNVKLAKQYDPSEYAGSISHTQVEVYPQNKTCPSEAVTMGNIFVGEAGFTVDCGYNKVVEIARMRAAKIGANAICIDRHRRPSMASSCHQIWGRMLYESDSEETDSDALTDNEVEAPDDQTDRKDKKQEVSASIHIISGKKNHKVGEIPIKINGEYVTTLNHPDHEVIFHEGRPEITIQLGDEYNKLTFKAEDGKDYYFDLVAHKQAMAPWSVRLIEISPDSGKNLIREINEFWAATPLRKEIPPQVSIGAHYGAANKMGQIDDTDPIIEELYEGMRWGTSMSGRLDFFFSRTGGMGFSYDQMYTSNSGPLMGIGFENSDDTLIGVLNGNIEIQSIGINYLRRHYSLNGLLHVTLGMGLSYNNYHETLEIGEVPILEVEGSTVGFNISLRGDVFLTKWLAVGGEVSYVASNFTKLKVTDSAGSRTIDLSESEQSVSGSFATFSGGIRFYF